MFRKIKIAALSAFLGLGTLAAMPATAQADGIYFSFGQGGPRVGVYDSGYSHRHYRRHACTPGQAVHKARRHGVRNAHVVRVNRNVIKVRGHRHHHRVKMVFARAPHCPIIR